MLGGRARFTDIQKVWKSYGLWPVEQMFAVVSFIRAIKQILPFKVNTRARKEDTCKCVDT